MLRLLVNRYKEFGPRGDHTLLCFVATCDNGVFNGGYLATFQYLFPPYLQIKKTTLMYFLASYIYF